jgi:hypothetical protein
MQNIFAARLFTYRSYTVTSLPFIPFYRHLHARYILNMDEAFLRYEKGSSTFDISFRYMNDTLQIDRQFNFSRQVIENVNKFLNRIDVNICKIINKKVR